MSEIDAKLSYLRQDAADALRIYLGLHRGYSYQATTWEQINLAALGYVNAQTKYTLACLEAKRGEILPYVELP